MNQPLASISLDLDNLWSYMKTHGDPGWDLFPSYLNEVVPRFLEFFRERGNRITVFVVGQDAILEDNQDVLQSIADAGHEIGNHSFSHEPWLHLYSVDELIDEFQKSEEAIFEATGKRTTGFRGPGFSCSNDVLNVLVARGYQYDASSFPTFLGPLARAYYFFRSSLNKKQKQDRKELFGKFSDGFQPNKPFRWQIGDRSLLEIPVTTMPIFKLPIHASYVMYLAGYSQWLARAYFWSVIQLCRLTRTQPSLLLHPLDFLDVNDAPVLEFFPAMKLPVQKKLKLLGYCLDQMDKVYQLVPMHVHADSCASTNLKQRVIPRSRGLAQATASKNALTSDKSFSTASGS